MSALKVGDGFDADVQIGPLINAQAVEKVRCLSSCVSVCLFIACTCIHVLMYCGLVSFWVFTPYRMVNYGYM